MDCETEILDANSGSFFYTHYTLLLTYRRTMPRPLSPKEECPAKLMIVHKFFSESYTESHKSDFFFSESV